MPRRQLRTNAPRQGIRALFPSEALVHLLALFFRHPGEQFYQRDLQERTGHALVEVQRALRRIVRSGLVTAQTVGNRVYYRAQPDHPAFTGLQDAFLKTVALADHVREALASLRPQIDLAFIYGSIARGTETGASDVDLLVVGAVRPLDVARALRDVSRELQREINPSLFTREEFVRRLDAGDHFLKRVLERPKVWLVGGPDGLRALGA